MKNKIMTFIGWSTITAVIVMTVTFMVWAFFPYQTIKFHSGSFETTKQTYKQGDTMQYRIKYCKFTEEMPEITKYYIDGMKIESIDNTPAQLSGIGCGEQLVDFAISPELPPGRWRIQIDVTYRPSPLQTKTITNYTNWIIVEEK